MKKIGPLVALLLGTGALLADSSVFFTLIAPFNTPADRLVYLDFVGGTKLVGTNWVAQLFYGKDTNSLVSVTNPPAVFRAPTTTVPGTWVGGTRFLHGFAAGDLVTLVIKAWDGSLFATFEEAGAAKGTRGESAPFTYVVPGPGSAPSAFVIENFRAFALQNPLINQPPIAQPEALSVNEDTPLPISLVAIDPDLDSLTFSVLTPPLHGTLSGQAPSLVYQPATNYNGPDAFTFRANDGQATSAPATVSIAVLSVNDPPVALPASLFVPKNRRASIVLRATDPENDSLTYFVTLPRHGSLSGTLPSVEYTPSPGYNGPDSFTFIANDGQANSGVATVAITVGPESEMPVAAPRVVSASLLSAEPGRMLLLARDQASTVLFLDGAASSNSTHDGLRYAWFVPGQTQPFATGPILTNRIQVGSHKIKLQVSDGADTASSTFTVEVITAAKAVESIRELVRDAQILAKAKTEFLTDLKSAEAAFQDGKFAAGVRWLQTFQNNVRDHLASGHAALAQQLLQRAQQLLNAILD